MAASSAFFFRPPAQFDEKGVSKHVTADVLPVLRQLVADFETCTEWTGPRLHELLSARATAAGLALGKLAQPIRLAVSGGTISPPIDATLAILGKPETLARLTASLAAWGA
jgi:glutamyl-tRNA synthetase